MSSLSASDLTTLRAARPGDILHIETAAGTRTVTVKSVEGRYIYTSSGAVRPGRVSGGFINVEPGAHRIEATNGTDDIGYADVLVEANTVTLLFLGPTPAAPSR